MSHDSGRVLVVDDEPMNRALLVSLLGPEGFSVTTAVDGVDALQKLGAEDYDLVLLDVLMPRIDGFETCRRLRVSHPDLPVVFVTALGDRDARLRAMDAGAEDLISKPIDDIELVARARNLVSLKRMREASGAERRKGELAAAAAAHVAHLQTVYRALPCGVMVCDSEGIVREANPATEEMFGVEPGRLVGTRVRDHVRSVFREDRTPFPFSDGPTGRAMRNRTRERQTLGIARKDGSERWIIVEAVPIFDDGGALKHVVAGQIDVTARVQAEHELARATASLSEVYDSMACGVVVFDVARKVAQINATAKAILGEAPLDALAPDELVEPRNGRPKSAIGFVELCLTTGLDLRQVELAVNHGAGALRWLNADFVCIKGDDGRAAGVICSFSDVTERRAAEAAYRALFEQAAMGVAEVDTQSGRFLRVNKKLGELTGFSEDELLELRVADLIHPDEDQTALERAVAGHGDEPPTLTVEQRCVRKDGSVVCLGMAVSPLGTEGEPRVRHMIVVSDVTVRKVAEVELKRREEFLRLSQEIAHVGSWDWDIARGHITFSDEMCRLHGQDPRTFAPTLGYGLAMYHPDDRERLAALLVESVEGRCAAHGEFRAVLPDGSVRTHVVSWNTYFEGDVPVRVVGANLDVTERRRREEDLELAQFTIDHAAEAFHLVDRDGRFLAVNEASCRMLGYSRAELLTMSVPDIDPNFPPDAWPAHWDELRARRTFTMDSSIVRKSGDLVPVEITVNLLTFGDREFNCATIRDVTERRRAEEALRKSEERHRRLFTDATEGMFRTNVNGALVDANPAFARLLGYGDASELLGRNVADLYATPTDGYCVAWRSSATRHEPFKATWRRAGGENVIVEIRGGVIRNDTHEGIEYQGFVQDITAREQYDAAQRALTNDLATTTGDDFFLAVATRLAEILGADAGFVGELRQDPEPTVSMLSFVADGAARSSMRCALRGSMCEHVVAGGATIVAAGAHDRFPHDPNVAKLGIEACAAAPLLDRAGAIIGYVGVLSRSPLSHPDGVQAILDVFGIRTAAEVERQRADARFAAVFENAPDAMLIVDRHGRIVLANMLAEETLGYRRGELLGLAVEDLVPLDARAEHVTLRSQFAASDGQRRMGSRRPRIWAVRKDGASVPVEISLSPLPSNDGPLVVAAMRDVSARQRMEEERTVLEAQLRHAQKMDSLGTLAGGIAHDFNNILAAILTNVELATDDVVPGTPIAESLATIGAASRRAANLVKQILAFGRRQPSSRVIMSVGSAVDEVVRLLRATVPSGIELGANGGDDVPPVLADPTHIHQVLMNLGTNAWHAIERPTGAISFDVDVVAVDPSSPVGGRVPRGRYVRVRVTDDGCGMDATTMGRVFEPFFTTKGIGRGTGLGLAVAHGIVADHGGAIFVESVPDRGSTFSVFLPEATGAVVPVTKHDTSARGARGGHVLLVDDEASIVDAMKRVLERRGYVVSGFVRARDALDAVTRDPRRFDVVVADVNMPELGGVELARSIGLLRADLPIVLASGNLEKSAEDLGVAGIVSTVDKPYATVSLCSVLERALGRK